MGLKKRPYAVFTLAHNEKVFLPIWLGYYSQFFAPEDIYVIDHDSNDGSIEEAQGKFQFNLDRVQTSTVFDHQFMMETVVIKRNELLTKYETVVYSDTDEFVIVDPQDYADLTAFLDSFKDPYIKSISRSVMHQKNEPSLDLSKKILNQRSVWFEEYGYDKVSVTRIPMNYSLGLHVAEPANGAVYPEASAKRPILLHLTRMDYELRKKRGELIQQERWGAEGDDGYQLLLTGEKLEAWFYDLPSKQAKELGHLLLIEKIPNRFKNML